MHLSPQEPITSYDQLFLRSEVAMQRLPHRVVSVPLFCGDPSLFAPYDQGDREHQEGETQESNADHEIANA